MNFSIKISKVLFANLFSVSFLHLVNILAPLITYPYLIGIYGMELYGYIVTAQLIVSYFSLIISYGSDNVCAKHIAIYHNDKEKLSEIVSSIFFTRVILWIICLVIYYFIIDIVPQYKQYKALFLLFYGITFHELLFQQYFFLGMEKMVLSTIVNILPKLLFISLVFICVKSKEDIILIPIFYSLGYFVGGVLSFLIVTLAFKITIKLQPTYSLLYYVKESIAVFASDIITTIKDKFNVLLLGMCVGMTEVVVYDLGTKFNLLINKPAEILRVVFFPRFAKYKNVTNLKKLAFYSFVLSLFLVLLLNVYLEDITIFFVKTEINLYPLRLFSICPLFLSISVIIAFDGFIAFGYTKYILYK